MLRKAMLRKTVRTLTLTLLGLASLSATDQDKTQQQDKSRQQNKPHQDVFVSGSPDENRIARDVRHQLVMLPYYGVFDDLAFRVDGSTVTLLGAVTRPTLKSDAEGVTKRVEGVTHVNNEITVLPLSPMDDQIRRATYRSIYGDPTLSTRYGFSAVPSIHIIVDNGRVTLEGVVASEADKNLVYLRANSVPNVFNVQNNLQVNGH
jgi:hyperosmotically inducible protein